MTRPVKPENNNSQPVSPSAFGQVLAYLAQRGYSQAWIEDVIGATHGGRDRAEIARLLMEAL